MAVAYQEKIQLRAQPQEKKTVFSIGMLVVVKLNGVLVEEDTARFFEGNSMFPKVRPGLRRIPFKTQGIHNYIVTTRRKKCKRLGNGRDQLTIIDYRLFASTDGLEGSDNH